MHDDDQMEVSLPADDHLSEPMDQLTVVTSPVVNQTFAHSFDEPARHLESEPIVTEKAQMDQVRAVTSPVVEEHDESSRSPEIRPSECAYPSGPPALPADDPMEVVNQTFAHSFDEPARHLESEPIVTEKAQMDQVGAVTSPVVEEHDESSRSPEIRASECAYPSGHPASLADNQMIE